MPAYQPGGYRPGQPLTYDQIRQLIPHVDEKYIRKLLDVGYSVNFYNSANVPGGDQGVGFTDPIKKEIQISNDPGISGNLAHEVVHGLQGLTNQGPISNFVNAVPRLNAHTGSSYSNLVAASQGLLAGLVPGGYSPSWNRNENIAQNLVRNAAGGINDISEFAPYGASPTSSPVQQGLLRALFPGYFTGNEPTGITAESVGLIGPSAAERNTSPTILSPGGRAAFPTADSPTRSLLPYKTYKKVGKGLPKAGPRPTKI